MKKLITGIALLATLLFCGSALAEDWEWVKVGKDYPSCGVMGMMVGKKHLQMMIDMESRIVSTHEKFKCVDQSGVVYPFDVQVTAEMLCKNNLVCVTVNGTVGAERVHFIDCTTPDPFKKNLVCKGDI